MIFNSLQLCKSFFLKISERLRDRPIELQNYLTAELSTPENFFKKISILSTPNNFQFRNLQFTTLSGFMDTRNTDDFKKNSMQTDLQPVNSGKEFSKVSLEFAIQIPC